MKRLILLFLLLLFSASVFAADIYTYSLFQLVVDFSRFIIKAFVDIYHSIMDFFTYMIHNFPRDVFEFMVVSFFAMVTTIFTILWEYVKLALATVNISSLVTSRLGGVAPEVISVLAYIKVFEAAQMIISARLTAFVIRSVISKVAA